MENGTTMRFVADAMLGRLAKWLRLVGYDTLYWRGDDAGLVRLALAENRVVLTRDTRIAPRLPPHLIFFIDSDYYDEQLNQVIVRFGLPPRIGRLCMRCNLPLEPADRAGLEGEIPPFVWRTQEQFTRCPGCLRIYWEGTHYARMKETIERAAATKTKRPAVGSNTAGGSTLTDMNIPTDSVIASDQRERSNLTVLDPANNGEIATASPRNDTGDFLTNTTCAAGAPMGMKVHVLYPSPPSSPQRGEESFSSMDPSPPCGGEGGGEGDFRSNVQGSGRCA